MTDFSQLPHLNPVAPLREEPWLRWSSWTCPLIIVWSWFNAVLVSAFVGDHLQSLWYYRRGACGSGLSRFVLVMEVSPFLMVLNLLLWATFAKKFPRHVWWVKLPALLAIVVWSGIVLGIQVGLALPDQSIPQLPRGTQP